MAKSKKLNPKDVESVIASLPKKDREEMAGQDITKEWLEQQIEYRNELMKRDLMIGIPWFVAYSASLFFVGMTPLTAATFVIGVVYFVYTIFTTGTYGDNRKRVGMYKELLEKLK